MKILKFLCLFLCCIGVAAVNAQTQKDSLWLIGFNQQIDDDVIARNIGALQESYADDFVFSHGSGRVEGKASWLKSVAKGGFTRRMHDSVVVEFHPQLALVRGRLSVKKQTKSGVNSYYLKYMRLYALRNSRWQMISHYTYAEVHNAQ